MRCHLCLDEATFRVEGYAESGWDEGYVYQSVCDEHVKSYQEWQQDNDDRFVDADGRIHGLEYITRIDNVIAGDRIREYTRLTQTGKGKYVIEDEEWEAIICGWEFGPIICNILTEEQLFMLAQALRRRIYDMVGGWIDEH